MVKDVNYHLKTRCVICWQLLRLKSPLLNGTKCNRNEIREKLKFLLPPQDFRSLFDENIFSNPRLCNLCFVTIRNIPKKITKVQNLFGKNINIKLYKPHRIEWKEDFRIVESFSGEKYLSETKEIKKTTLSLQTVDLPKTFKSDSNIVLPYTPTEREQCKVTYKNEANNLLGRPNIEYTIDECTDSFLFNSTLETTDKVLSDIITPKEEQLSGDRLTELTHLPLSSLKQSDTLEIESKKLYHSLSNVKKELSVNLNLKKRQRNKRTKNSGLGQKLQPLRESRCVATVKRQNTKKYSKVQKISGLDFISDVSFSDSEDEYIPPSQPEDKKRKYFKFSKRENSSKSIKKSPFRNEKSLEAFITKSNLLESETNGNESRYEIRFNAGKRAFKTDIPSDLSEFSKSRLKELAAKVKRTLESKKNKLKKILIQCSMNNCNHFYPYWSHMAIHLKYYHFNGLPPEEDKFIEKLCMFADWKELDKNLYPCNHRGCDLAFSEEDFLKEHKLIHETDLVYICDFPDCTKAYKMATSLHAHFRSHTASKSGQHKCPYGGCGESFVKKEKLEIHLCSHSPERQLFCEKCGKKFSCQRYLDVHYKIHLKNEKHATQPLVRNIPCEFPGCNKMFTTRENMKSHVLNQHRGRKPKSLPGVFFSCTMEGCGKKFTFRSTLYRHNKLVHQGGDYKLGKEIVKYSCTYAGCCMVFNRKNLLEEHMVMEHGKLPKRLLPLRNKEFDFIERICVYCGMVLTVTQLPRHEEIYHSEKAVKDSKESSPYPCHLKGCDELFNTIEDRKVHVQFHIRNPPYNCQAKNCQEIFYLEKNLDNHLWNHNKKVSVCDFVGCGQEFEDQLQLAKHSKIHYDQKMKCPWPNCDIWLTETGHLKPHFIAHSRSLMANYDLDFVCEICQLAFSSKWGLMIHKRMHGEDAAAKPSLSKLTKFRCEEPGCDGTFTDQKGFFDHFLYHYTNISARCIYPGCPEKFKNMITMCRHTKHHYVGRYLCPWQGCEKLFASVFIVKKHLYHHIMASPVVSANREFPCSQCFMIFRLKVNLLSHMEHHNKDSDYVCPTCGKKGRHSHIKPQRLSKPHKSHVCLECNACYATVSGFKLHLLQKHQIGKWPFQCNYCGKGFVSSREMQRHIPSHTKEKPFVCNICGASFASHTGHRAHLRKHSGQKYVCDVEGCSKVYTTSISLKGHRAQHEGFSKTCTYCNKTYKNPYGHKCKASRDNKKNTQSGQNQRIRHQVTLPVNMLPIALQTVSPPAHQVQHPAAMSVQHTVIMPQQLITHNMNIQQVVQPIMGPAQSHIQQQNQVIPQSLPHQDRTESISLDVTRENTVNMTADYTFNNYVVFWESQNIQ